MLLIYGKQQKADSSVRIEVDTIYGIAKRLAKFLQYDWYDYADFAGMDVTEEIDVESMMAALADEKTAQDILNTLQDMLANEPDIYEDAEVSKTVEELIADISEMISYEVDDGWIKHATGDYSDGYEEYLAQSNC